MSIMQRSVEALHCMHIEALITDIRNYFVTVNTADMVTYISSLPAALLTARCIPTIDLCRLTSLTILTFDLYAVI